MEFINPKMIKPLEVDITQFLDRFGGHPNGRDGAGWTPLLVAVKWGYTETVKELLRRKANPSLQLAPSVTGMVVRKRTCSPLSLAQEEGHTEIVKLLKEAGATE